MQAGPHSLYLLIGVYCAHCELNLFSSLFPLIPAGVQTEICGTGSTVPHPGTLTPVHPSGIAKRTLKGNFRALLLIDSRASKQVLF